MKWGGGDPSKKLKISITYYLHSPLRQCNTGGRQEMFLTNEAFKGLLQTRLPSLVDRPCEADLACPTNTMFWTHQGNFYVWSAKTKLIKNMWNGFQALPLCFIQDISSEF